MQPLDLAVVEKSLPQEETPAAEEQFVIEELPAANNPMLQGCGDFAM